ncbi:MAG TPA: Ig-like domain-containing protein [Gemmatimonadaceae bacterium]
MRSSLLSLAALLAAVAACSDVAAPDKQPNRNVVSGALSGSAVVISPTVDTVEVGKTIQLKATVTGSSDSTQRIYWGVNDTTVAGVNHDGVVTGRKAGTAKIVAIAGREYTTSTVVVRSAATVEGSESADSASVTVPSGALFSGYAASSPHYPHIRTMMTDFYYGWTSSERQWAGEHYDWAMSGNADAWRSANPGVTHVRYTLLWTTLIPGQQSEDISGVYYGDMRQWFAAHPGYKLENAFLHTSAARDSASRLVLSIWDSKRWVINPADPGARAYTVDRYRRIAATENGVFVDETGSGDILGRVKTAVELPTSAEFQTAYTSLIAAIKQVFGSKHLMLNIAEYSTAFDKANAIAAGTVHLEHENNPMRTGMANRWTWIEGLRDAGVTVDIGPVYSSTYLNDHPDMYPSGGLYHTSAERSKMWELSSYYMIVGSNPDGLNLALETGWKTAYSSRWLKAQEANIGHPTAPRSEYRTGTDPTGKPYTVYGRDFDRALVLVRVQRGWGSQTYGSETAVSVPLPTGEQWLPLHADGTLGAPVTSIKLRNSEAVILVKKSRVTG